MAIAILAIGVLVKNIISKPKDRPVSQIKKNVKSFFTTVVKNDSIPVYVESTGTLEAIKRMSFLVKFKE